MLSDTQIKRVWEGMLTAEFRGYYFAYLASASQSTDRWIGFWTLFLSAGFIASAVSKLPESVAWIPIALSIVTGGLSMLRVALQFYKRSVDCTDLSTKWQKLARDYTRLWENVYRDDASEILESIDDRADELSKPGIATGKPDQKRLEHWWNYVLQQNRLPCLSR